MKKTHTNTTFSHKSDVKESDDALIYVALLGTSDEAPAAIKSILAQINNDHANFPHTIIFGVHSDRDGDFVNEELDKYCCDDEIHKSVVERLRGKGYTVTKDGSSSSSSG